jgi:putative ATPase
VAKTQQIPLAERMRPATLDQFVGQERLLASGSLLRQMIEADEISSFILWGPPGTGKTTLARLLALHTSDSVWIAFSAVTSGIKEIKGVMAEAEAHFNFAAKRTILFVDEIHRFNRAQQDAFLPYVESGTIVLIGATTENPSFELNSALLSRLKVFILEELSIDHVVSILRRAADDKERGLGALNLEIDDDILRGIAVYSSGDARTALNSLELLAGVLKRRGIKLATEEHIKDAVQQAVLKYDKTGEHHYNLISALHKSIRNSDADASLYWLARMLEAGEDPIYVARRLVRFASEDIGLAHPPALEQTIAAMHAVELIGLPEGKLALAQAVVFLSYCPKSNAVYKAYNAAAADAHNTLQYPVPLHLRNAPTSLMKDVGYGKGYKYAHDYADGVADMRCLPPDLQSVKYFEPSTRGFEGKLRKIQAGQSPPMQED